MVDAQAYAVILDRDKTINHDPGYLSDPNLVELMPGAADGIKLFNSFGIPVFVATNQSGVARGLITSEQLIQVNNKIAALLAESGARIEKIYSCPHVDENNCDCRKPKSGLVRQIVGDYGLNPAKTFIAGDRARDIECGQAMGLRGILIGREDMNEPSNMVFRAETLHEAAAYILEAIFEAETQSKIFSSFEAYANVLAEVQTRNPRIVFTNGCFDILHGGHVQLLAQARALGGYLILGLNSDRSVSKLKGPERPVNSQYDRARILAQLPYVDAVVIFDEDTPIDLLKSIAPDIHVKGGDYVKENLPEYSVMRALNKEIVILPFRKGYSTTGILERSRS
jgi:rfaE bifunctional protein nucleotidyltransferase chain/domain